MSRSLKRTKRTTDFVSDNGGNTAMIFGLSFIPVMFALGAATDYTRLTIARAELQQGTDAAALAVASKLTQATTVAEAKNQAQVILNSRRRLASATVSEVTISQDRATVCATSQMTIPNAFMQLAKIGSLTSGVKSCANLAASGDPDATLEIALVVDNSGSMSSSAGGVSKMQALKNSANTFVDSIFAKSPNVKMSIVPFAAGVVALDPTQTSNRSLPWIDTQGNNSQHWIVYGGKAAATAQGFTSRFDVSDRLTALRSSWRWGGCLEGPTYPLNVNDMTPSSNDPETLFVPYVAPDEPATTDWWGNFVYGNHYLSDSGGACSGNVSGDWARLTRTCKYRTPSRHGSGAGPNSHCPNANTQTLLQLTPTKATLTTKINQLVEGGNTNLHEGFMWGWRTLSPNRPFAGGRSYNAPKNRKVMIFMTDGTNVWNPDTNTVTGSTYQALGYYSYNGTANARFPDGTQGNGVNYQTLLAAAANKSSSYQSIARQMQDELTRQACTNAKAAGIEVFTIGFSVSTDPIDTQGLNLLRDCATNPDHYFEASNATQLGDAFASVSAGLGKLRLSQ